jgi:hypothetical protein
VDELKPALEKLSKFFRTYRQLTSE